MYVFIYFLKSPLFFFFLKDNLYIYIYDVFSIRTRLERASIAGLVGLLCKNKKQKGLAGARPLPLRCLSQLFSREEKINCLGNVLCVSMRTFY